jgi:tRNA A37 methylthiotransferase MiaB
MREKLLGVAGCLRELAKHPDADIMTPSQTVNAIAEAIETVLNAEAKPIYLCPFCKSPGVGFTASSLMALDSHVTTVHGKTLGKKHESNTDRT